MDALAQSGCSTLVAAVLPFFPFNNPDFLNSEQKMEKCDEAVKKYSKGFELLAWKKCNWAEKDKNTQLY